MPILRWIPLAVFAAAGIASAPLLAQPVAEKPDLEVGDQWVFHETGIDSGKAVDRRWMRRIAELLPDEKIRVERYAGSDTYDMSWNPRHPDRPEFWPLNFQFPLRVGAEWSFASPPGGNYYQRGNHTVVAYESITVPAGTFDCFRLEGVSVFSTKSQVETRYMTRWYCPAVKYIAKLHTELNIWRSYGPGSRNVLDSELVQVDVSHVAISAPVVVVSRYDGTWIATLTCEAFQERPAFTDEKPLTVRGGEFVLAYGTPGQPGSSRVSGRASESGTLRLDGTGVSNAQASRGHEYRARMEGRHHARDDFGDEGFVLNGHYGARKCALTITRAGG